VITVIARRTFIAVEHFTGKAMRSDSAVVLCMERAVGLFIAFSFGAGTHEEPTTARQNIYEGHKPFNVPRSGLDHGITTSVPSTATRVVSLRLSMTSPPAGTERS